jgi:hypothetical protein
MRNASKAIREIRPPQGISFANTFDSVTRKLHITRPEIKKASSQWFGRDSISK